MLMTGANIEYEVFASISNTALSEAIEFSSSSFFILPSIGVLILFLGIYFRLLKTKKGVDNKHSFTTHSSILILLIGIVGLSSTYIYKRDALYKTYPLSIPFYLKKYYKDVVLFKKEFKKINYAFEGINEHVTKNSTCILMIGETARSQSMSIYGYTRDTTPNMQQAIDSNDIKATKYNSVSSGVSTRLSVPLLLSTINTIESIGVSSAPTLPHIFNNVNIGTELISNQEIAGRNNDIIALILNQMKVLTYLSKSDVTRGYDIELIPHIKDSIQNEVGALLMVAHLMGSHWKYDQRYPSNFSYFSKKDNTIDTYDNSIRYTDHIIGEVIEIMMQSSKPICLIYTSDHGENLNDNNDGNYLHAINEMTQYEVQVPLFFVSNPTFYNQYKGKVDQMVKHKDMLVSHDNISHTLLGLAGIYDVNYYKAEYDLSSPEFTQSKRYALNRRGEIINVDDYLKKNQ
jgi:glucan phosphoethanolaminetransferase (alkaline phosphatase superfamily)